MNWEKFFGLKGGAHPSDVEVDMQEPPSVSVEHCRTDQDEWFLYVSVPSSRLGVEAKAMHCVHSVKLCRATGKLAFGSHGKPYYSGGGSYVPDLGCEQTTALIGMLEEAQAEAEKVRKSIGLEAGL